MLTPVEIQNRVFKSGGLGYDKKDVDSFMKEIVNSYEMLYREKMELMDKVNVLNDGIQNYKTIEKTMQKALLLAQKTAEETQENALRQAHAIEKEAVTKSEMIIGDAKRELEMIQQQTVKLLQQYERYKLQFKNLAAAQIELLESDSFQINIMDYQVPELKNPAATAAYSEEVSQPETVPAPELTQKVTPKEEVPKINISFTNVAEDR